MQKHFELKMEKISDTKIRLTKTTVNESVDEISLTELIARRETIAAAIRQTHDQSRRSLEALQKQLDTTDQRIADARAAGVKEDPKDPR